MGNMDIWEANSSIPSQYTKRAKLNGQEITSYSLQAVLLMATKQFGPIGKGWGYDVVEEKNEEGAVITQGQVLVGENGQQIEQREVREVLHTLVIKCWYMLDGERYDMPVQAGHTPKVMRTKYGAKFDDEYYKKTLADAIKKSLSMLGFGAEIYLGLLDDQHYLAMKAEEDAIKFESEKSGRIEALVKRVNGWCGDFKYNSLPQSIKAQLNGFIGEVSRECRSLGVNPEPYTKKLTEAAEARRDELTNKSK